MKCWIVSLLIVLGGLQAFGQQEYFIYVQSNNNQPFYIRINAITHSSEAGGYSIISQLPDSTCNMVIGFPGSSFPEQEFSVPVNKKDAGYLLTNSGERGWAMVNLQTQSVIMNHNTEQQKKKPEVTGIKRTDAFSVLLSNAVNDSAVLYTVTRPPKLAATVPSVSTKEETKIDSITIAAKRNVKNDTALIAKKRTPNKNKAPAIGANAGKNAPIIAVIRDIGKTDTTAIAQRKIPKNDTLTSTLKKLPVKKDTIGIVKNNLTKNKNTITQAKKAAITGDTTAIAKNIFVKRDSVSLRRKMPAKNDSSGIAKSGPVKKTALLPTPKKKYTDAELDAIIKRNIVIADSLMKEKKKSAVTQDAAVITENRPLKTMDSTTAVPKIPEKMDSAIISKPDVAVSVNRKPSITKAAELLTDTSYIAVFIDQLKESYDTIRISIPFYETATARKEIKETEKEIKTADTAHVKAVTDTTLVLEPIRKDKPAIREDSPVAVIKDTLLARSESKPVMVNSDCTDVAWDSDIDKLRIKMLLVKTTEEKIILAKKIFTQKCFTVKQVRALSELFTTDEAKYKWCDAVYSFVSDSANFSSLADLFREVYYLNRFKAMLRN